MRPQQLVRGRRAQDVDDRADEAQDGDFDQRDDEADRHESGEEGPDLAAIARNSRQRGSPAACSGRGRETGRCRLQRNGTWVRVHRDLEAKAGFRKTAPAAAGEGRAAAKEGDEIGYRISRSALKSCRAPGPRGVSGAAAAPCGGRHQRPVIGAGLRGLRSGARDWISSLSWRSGARLWPLACTCV